MFQLSALATAMLKDLGFPMHVVESHAYDNDEFSPLGYRNYLGHNKDSMVIENGVAYGPFDDKHNYYDLRSHPALVKVVEMLGLAAASGYCRLRIEEVDDDTPYRIEDYDGAESVRIMRPEDYTDGYVMTDIAIPDEIAMVASAARASAEEVLAEKMAQRKLNK